MVGKCINLGKSYIYRNLGSACKGQIAFGGRLRFGCRPDKEKTGNRGVEETKGGKAGKTREQGDEVTSERGDEAARKREDEGTRRREDERTWQQRGQGDEVSSNETARSEKVEAILLILGEYTHFTPLSKDNA